MKTKSTNFYVAITSIPIIGCGLYYYYFILKKRKQVFLEDPNMKYTVHLHTKENVSHDTRKFRFKIPENLTLGLPIGNHIYLNADIDGKKVIRPYTPISLEEAKGYFDLVIKVYKKGVNPNFPEGGKMSQHLDNLNIGDTIEIKGPSGLLKYLGGNEFAIKLSWKDKDNLIPPKLVKANRIGMIAGGTGITPMYQLLQAVLHHPTPANKHMTFDLIFANQTEKDILIRDELEALAKKFPDRFRIWYTVDKLIDEKTTWSYDTGYVNATMISTHLPPPPTIVNAGKINEPVSPTETNDKNLDVKSPEKTEDVKQAASGDSTSKVQDIGTLILACGPPPMIKFAVKPALEKLGYSDANIFIY